MTGTSGNFDPDERIRISVGVASEPDEDGYFLAECFEIPGCISQGKTTEEALTNIQNAIQMNLMVMLEDSLEKNRRDSTPGFVKAFAIAPPALLQTHEA